MSGQNTSAGGSTDTASSAQTVDRQEQSLARRAGKALVVPFYNDEQGRPRAGWRILVAVVVAIAGTIVVSPVLRAPFGLVVGSVLDQAFRLGLVGGIVVLWARYIDRRPLTGYGLSIDADSARNLLAGLAIGTGIPALALAIFLAGGWAEVTGVAHTGSATLPFALVFLGFAASFAFVGVWEELLFRGLFIRNAAEGLSWLPNWVALVGAWVVSSATFALVHFSQVATPTAFLFYVLLGGGLLGTAYVVSGDLALPIGLHIAFNFASNTLFGLTGVVSDTVPSALQLSFTGPDTIVGIPGIVHAATIVVGIATTLAWVRYHRGEISLRTDFAVWQPRDDDDR